MSKILGIGSRIRHAEYGDGVIINVKSSGYNITFMQFGMKIIKLDFPLEIIEEVEQDNDLVSLLDVEMTLSKVLQKWSDFTENVPLGDKWASRTTGLGSLSKIPAATGRAATNSGKESLWFQIASSNMLQSKNIHEI